MRILGYIICHYGLPYLDAVLRSLAPQVEKIVILYTPTPSQGHTTPTPCHDSREALKAIADKYPCVQWIDGIWANEGAHCNAVHAYSQGYDWLVRADTDEVLEDGAVARWIEAATPMPNRHFSPKFLHFWRSFNWACGDGHTPVRLTRLNGGDGLGYLDAALGRVLHFGYAQPTPYIQYKMLVQGHHDEWRREWFATKWLKNAKADLHPVCVDGFWTAQPFDKSTLPASLRDHPYFGLDVI